MANNLTVLAPVLGGTALVLGLAYGYTAREYRAAELETAQIQAIAAAAREESALTRLAEVQQELGSFKEAAEAQNAEMAAQLSALKDELEAQKAAAQTAAASAPVIEAPVADETEAEPAAVVASASPTFGDADRGERIYKQCTGCHQVGAGAKNRAGPHLNGVFGRKAGVVEGFKYSKAMVRASNDGLVWDADLLDAYIENPRVLITGTRMSFRGVKDEQERHDLIAYLRRFSDNPQDIPESAPTASAREVELPPEILAIVGDAEYGEYLSSECLTCHQPDGADEGIPSIVYWPEEDFVVAMHAYKQKLRPHPVMQLMAGRLSDEEIAA